MTHPDNTEPSAEAVRLMRILLASCGRDGGCDRIRHSLNNSSCACSLALDRFRAAERERIARRVSERCVLQLQTDRDPLVEVNEIIQDLAHDIATNWADYEDDEP